MKFWGRKKVLDTFSPPAGGGGAAGASEEMSRQRRDANACLLFGIISFATLPAVLALVSFMVKALGEGRAPGAVVGAVIIVFFVTGFSAGVLALVRGRRANQAIRRIEGRIFGDDRATPGMVLGAVGAGIWSLAIILSLIVPNMLRSRLPTGTSPVGALRTINTAAITYSCSYGHGFPLKLSNLGRDPSKKGETSDQAAGLIDDILASGTEMRYRFYYVAGPVDSEGKILTYTVHADPIDSHAGDMHYFTDQSGVIRQQSKRQANVSSPPLDNQGGGSGSWRNGGSDDCSDTRKIHSSQPQISPPSEGQLQVEQRPRKKAR